MTEYEVHQRIEKLEADVSNLRALVDGLVEQDRFLREPKPREPGEEG